MSSHRKFNFDYDLTVLEDGFEAVFAILVYTYEPFHVDRLNK